MLGIVIRNKKRWWHGEWLGGQDRSDPSCDTDAIQQIEKMGIHVVPELYKYAAKDTYGDVYYHPGYS